MLLLSDDQRCYALLKQHAKMENYETHLSPGNKVPDPKFCDLQFRQVFLAASSGVSLGSCLGVFSNSSIIFPQALEVSVGMVQLGAERWEREMVCGQVADGGASKERGHNQSLAWQGTPLPQQKIILKMGRWVPGDPKKQNMKKKE